MKYRVITVYGDEQKVVLETDDLWIASTVADTLEGQPFRLDVYIAKEEEN